MGSAPARPVQAERAASSVAAYPTAVELVSSGDDWRAWLDEALRRVLAPAALAGAIGVAAVGCGTGGSVLESFGASPVATATSSAASPLSPFGPAVSAKPPTGAPIASLSPVGPPTVPLATATPPVTIATSELLHARPLPPRRSPVPRPHPAMMGGGGPGIAFAPPPAPPPPRPVQVAQPSPRPIALPGGGRPAYAVPVIVPSPDPPSVEGDIQFVSP